MEGSQDRLDKTALGLSGEKHNGFIVRLLAVKPELLLMNEPSSALDSISAMKIKNLLQNDKIHK